MGFWGDLFGGKKKKKQKKDRPFIPRGLKAVERLARRRGCSIYELDLYDDGIFEELLLLGLALSDDGGYYVNDPEWTDSEAEVTTDEVENLVAEGSGTFETTETTTELEATPAAGVAEPATETETLRVDTAPAPLPPVYEAPPPAPAPEPERSNWTSEVSESSWSSGSSDSSSSGGGFDSGGGGDD